MTQAQAGQEIPPAAPAVRRGRPIIFIVIGVVVLIGATVIGAYLDWMWWPAYDGIVITIIAAAMLPLGGVVWSVGRLTGRRVAGRVGTIIVAIAVGLVVGQVAGPSREPLIVSDGTMTLRLESPVVATGTSPATCSNGASQTEFAVSGDSNMRLDTPDRPFMSVNFDVGGRWEAIDNGPRKDGVRLWISGTDPIVPASGKPADVGMQATSASTLVSTFSNRGGSMRFSGLSPQGGPDFSGDTIDFAGTIEWTCGEALP
jgi:hypothetical protein